ncbi:hypothetical protein AOLI_G00165380 [Acnodon oligacanthus]
MEDWEGPIVTAFSRHCEYLSEPINTPPLRSALLLHKYEHIAKGEKLIHWSAFGHACARKPPSICCPAKAIPRYGH